MNRYILGAVAALCGVQAFATDCIPSGVVDQYTYFVGVDATDFTTRETGLSSFTVYRSRNGGAATAFTTPTVNETDATNMPGTYELLLDEDMTLDAGDDVQHMAFHITHAGMAPVTKEICIGRPKVTAGNTLAVAADGDAVEVNALTGHTVQTGDAYARIGAPVGASLSADLQVLDQNVDDIETDTADMQPKLGTFSDLGSGATLAGNLEDMRDDGTASYSRTTDSLQAIRDRGDAAWTTGGAGGDPSIQSTTVATVTSQTILVPTATPTFIDQINGWAVYLEDAGDADAYHLTTVTNYDETTGAVTIAEAAPFTVASTDTMVFLPAFMDQGVDISSISGDTTAAANAEAFFDGTGYAGTGNVIPTVTTLTNTPAWNASWDAEVESEVNDAMVALHLDHLFATDYDPTSKPGTATALLNELIQSDLGVSQFTANALETAPSGSSITDWTADERTAISAILGLDGTATPADPSAGILDTVRDDTVDLQARLPAALVGGRIDATVDATGMEAGAVSAIQSGLATSAAVAALNNLSSAEAQTAAAAALTAYDPPTDTEMDAAFVTYLEQQARADAAVVNCTVNTANFAGSTTTVACILTDRDAGAITAASGDLEGKELLILSGAQIYEGRFINDSTWDGVNSELRLTLSRALPGTLADAVTAIIR